MKLTRPSTKSYYQVFLLKNNEYALKCKNKLFLINDDGEVVTDSLSEERIINLQEEYYYLDYCSIEAIRCINCVTENYDIPELIRKLIRIMDRYQTESFFESFDMEDYNTISIPEDVFNQQYFLKSNKDFLSISKEYSLFVRQYFFDRSTEFSSEDRINLAQKITMFINELKKIHNS